MNRRGSLNHVRVRVTAAALLAALVVGVLGSFLFVNSLRNDLTNGLISSSEQQMQAVRAQLAQGEVPERAVVSGKNDVLVQVIGANGNVIATDHAKIRAPLRSTPGISKRVRVNGLSESYVVVAGRELKGQRIVAVGRSNESVSDATETAGVLLAISVPLGLALLAVVVWLSVGRALRPVEAMRRQAATISSAHLTARLEVPGGTDEIPRLAQTLNQMLDRIDATNSSQRQFVSDASHELRSPLAAIRQLAEVARDYPDGQGTIELARDVLTEEQRMEELVTSLLLLARLDDDTELRLQAVDLDDVVLEEVRRSRSGSGTSAQPLVRLDAAQVGAAQVAGDPVLLGQVVRNLVSNALRHARSEVLVGLREEGHRAVLTVSDDGNGVPPQERERIFDRFVRLDESRTREAGGAGLGLAIVHKIVHDLDGSVEVVESGTGGAVFVVCLPLAALGG
ncbi:MAG: ATP-binding protein [Marmoricola sp.]